MAASTTTVQTNEPSSTTLEMPTPSPTHPVPPPPRTSGTPAVTLPARPLQQDADQHQGHEDDADGEGNNQQPPSQGRYGMGHGAEATQIAQRRFRLGWRRDQRHDQEDRARDDEVDRPAAFGNRRDHRYDHGSDGKSRRCTRSPISDHSTIIATARKITPPGTHMMAPPSC